MYMLLVQVCDQVGAVRHFIEQGIVSEAVPVGVYGWSYGGYLSATCLLRAPDVFGYAMSGAPVTTWEFYDTHYTERYMHLPQNNIVGYQRSSAMTHVRHFAEQDAKMRDSPGGIMLTYCSV
jgi:dipeptidyl aminopeptidase/acylaminoacyl peptidase